MWLARLVEPVDSGAFEEVRGAGPFSTRAAGVFLHSKGYESGTVVLRSDMGWTETTVEVTSELIRQYTGKVVGETRWAPEEEPEPLVAETSSDVASPSVQ